MSNYENFDEQKKFACRVIADHARATAFAIADGILPGNEGRNYVLRKIMRRAIYHGREHLGFDKLFFHKVCGFVVEQMKDAYPELAVQKDFIDKMVRLEEERFGNTMIVGLKKLDELFADIDQIQKWNVVISISEDKFASQMREDISKTPEIAKNALESGELPDSDHIKELLEKDGGAENHFQFMEMVFKDEEIAKGAVEMRENWTKSFFTDLAKLYDTFGTPKDLIRVKLEEDFVTTGKNHHLQISEDFFNKYFDEALIDLQSKGNIGKTQQAEKINPIYAALQRTSVKSNFHGYDKTEVEGAKVLALVKNDERVDALDVDDEGLIVLDETPFYAEAGGQVGDVGVIFNADSQIKVFDTFAPIAGIVLHKAKVEKGTIKVGDEVTAQVDVFKRDATRRNHTATHLVHAALKEVLGTHVKQAGSVVAPNYLRFDFTHYQPISESELTEIEDLVNRYILENHPVTTNVMAIEEAMRSGAVALFGEKYGADVRVLSVGSGEFSRELCGGTHVKATGDIGSFKITSDEAIASGVRRIRAITGFDSFARFREDEKLISDSLNVLKTQRDNLPNAIEKLQEELKKTRKEIDDLKMKIATGAIGGASANGDEVREINGVKVVAKQVDGLDKGGMRHLSDTLMAKIKSGVVILGRAEDEKVSIIVRVSEDLIGNVKAGNIITLITPIVGGRGGGKADMAEGGGNLPEKLGEAINQSYQIIADLTAP